MKTSTAESEIDPRSSKENARYVLVTAAYNEEKHLERTIKSIVAQTRAPKAWVIVSDGSTDRTDQIVASFARSHSFIRLLRIAKDHPRDFAAQVFALQAGLAELRDLEFEFIGNLDADIAVQPTYFEELLKRFHADSEIGLAGGAIYEKGLHGFRSRPGNSSTSVAHAVQMFRRACFESVGGYLPLKYGGPDWVAEVRARQAGWRVCSFKDLPAYHFRPTMGAEGLLRGCWRQGCMDYSVGSLPSFEVFKCARRLPSKPYVIGAAARFLAFSSSYLKRAPRLMPEEFIHYLQREQRKRLKSLVAR